METKKTYNILSPDGIPISMENFETKSAMIAFFESWKDRFKTQGYYSANRGKIQLSELFGNCKVVID